MHIADLIRSRDGSLSQTKLASACFHFSLFITAGYVTYIKQAFILDMWTLYAAVAVGHTAYDKTLATVKDFKDRQLASESPTSQSSTTISTIQQTTQS